MRKSLSKWAGTVCLLIPAAAATAQSTWNYFVSDAGEGNSLVSWSVTGSLAASPGAILQTQESSLPLVVDAPGIFLDAYTGSGGNQPIPTPDGSVFELNGGLYSPLSLFEATSATAGGNDSFGLIAVQLPYRSIGYSLTYVPGSQSAIIPIAYSDFNPGTYQSTETGLSSPLTVILTVGPVPEPPVLALWALGGWGTFWFYCRRAQPAE